MHDWNRKRIRDQKREKRENRAGWRTDWKGIRQRAETGPIIESTDSGGRNHSRRGQMRKRTRGPIARSDEKKTLGFYILTGEHVRRSESHCPNAHERHSPTITSTSGRQTERSKTNLSVSFTVLTPANPFSSSFTVKIGFSFAEPSAAPSAAVCGRFFSLSRQTKRRDKAEPQPRKAFVAEYAHGVGRHLTSAAMCDGTMTATDSSEAKLFH
ncbi:hypothetical protein EVAR_16721_1 [Eumeta japonica]|uniref:Uncharacterized protein n=1 Tax=Eumeta variegata TaxID=151549 RepID=A0A4C1V4E5_EUMVA|nr:hypothetical protein EVAR_16721_1 [Eumeta japonica]